MLRRFTVGLMLLFVLFAAGGFFVGHFELDIVAIVLAGLAWLGIALITALIVVRGIAVGMRSGDDEW